MASAVRDDNPVVYLMHYLLVLEHGDVPEGEYLVRIGEAAVRRPGSDVTIVATGWTVGKALAAAETLAAEGIEAEVIDPRTPAAARYADDPDVGREDRPCRARRPGHPARLGRLDHRRRDRRARLLLAQGADQARHRARRDDPVQRADGGVRAARRGARSPMRPARCSGPRPSRPERSRRAPVPLGRKRALALLATMWRIRCFEERVARLHHSLLVHGLIHLSIGSEGVAAAVCGALRTDDAVYSGHRAHGHAIAKGAPMDRVMAELMGRSAGLCHGLGGSMHLVDREHGLMGATGVVGGNLPLAAGDALAARLRGSDQVTVAFFGDGAVQAGHFNESVNLAALWELPLIFVCENNGFAEFTPRSAHTKVERVCDVVAPYGFERQTVDGGDVPALWGGVRRLRRRRARRARADAAGVPHAPTARATTRATRSPTARSWPMRSGPSSTRSRVCRRSRPSGAGSTRPARRRSTTTPAPRSSGRSSSRARAHRPTPELAADWCTRDDDHLRAGGQPRRWPRAMRADGRVIVLGEDVAEGGPYDGDRRPRRGVRHRAGAQHADQRGGRLRGRDRRRAGRAAAGGRDHVHRLHHAGARPARQPGGQGALHVRRPADVPRSCCAPRAAPAARRARSTRRASRRGSRTSPG